MNKNTVSRKSDMTELSKYVKIHLGDNIEFMRAIPDQYYDIAIVDPPYGINAPNMAMGTNKSRTKNGYPGESTASKLKGRLNTSSGKLKDRFLNNSLIEWDVPPPAAYWDELFRISKNQIIFGSNYFQLPPTRCIGFWDKIQPWENFSQFELIWTSFDQPAFKIKFSNRGGANKEVKIHPTQKPVYVYRALIKKFVTEGMKVFDAGYGSGSICIACDMEKIEIEAVEDKPYYQDEFIKRFGNYSKHKTKSLIPPLRKEAEQNELF